MKSAFVLLIGMLSVGINVAVPAQQPQATQADDEGLAPVRIKGLDHVYVKPGARLQEYNKIMLDPIEVSFSKSWDPDTHGGPISTAERQRIRDGLAKIIRDELRKALAATGRYSLVDAADTGVLRVRAEIRDLYMNAPSVPSAGPTRTYALSVGEMRLVAELRDAPTGALIARVIDLKRDPDAPWLHLTTTVDNVAAARRAAADWARILIRQMDAAHEKQG